MANQELALQERIETLVALALAEDFGAGDLSAEFFVDEAASTQGRIVARESGVLAGMDAACATFRQLDPSLELTRLAEDGAELNPGSAVLELSGSARQILGGERTALNFLQRLSGIATATRRCVEAVAGTNCAILDTRKTTPAWRLLEKAAVRAGGGENHRMGLYDRAMVKDNHLLSGAGEAGALERGVANFVAARPDLELELEADTLEQVERFLVLAGVDWILLDNMDNATMAEAVARRDQAVAVDGQRIKLEGSGNMTLERLAGAAATGIDAISLGALTHSVMALDLGMDFV